MKLSIVVNATPNATSLAADIPLKEAVNLAADIGFTGVELAIADPSDIDVAQVTQLLESYELKVPALGTGAAYKEGLSLAHPDETRRAKAIERLKAHVDLGAVLEADVIVGLIRGKMSDGLSYDEAVNHIKSGLSEVSAYAKQKNVRILLEPINRYEIDLFNTIEDAYSIASQLDDNVGLLIDTFHMNIEESSLTEPIYKAGDRIWHVHIADNTRWAPGFGCFDFRKVINTLKDIEYEGYLSAEIMHMPDYKTAFKKVFEYISPIISYR
ncbi:MAG: sugar phosphate isomerase/epimerase [Firmicutes bacterium]|nr:sugar phosphate isomerase/epimerase [Bacillota bacterium]